MSKFKVIVAIILVIILGSVFFWGSVNNSTNVKVVRDTSVPDTKTKSSDTEEALVSNPTLSAEEKLKTAKINYLKQTYGDRIDNPYWQLKLIDQLMRVLQKEFPLNWENELIEMLTDIFPDYADALIKMLYAHIEYIAWIDSLKVSSTFENSEARRQAIWEKRLELFGEDAYQIWEAVLKQEKFDDHMKKLAKSSETFDKKSAQYISSMKAVFGDNVLESGHKTQMISHFLNLESVQNDLHEMTEGERRAHLQNYRKAMGLDDAALDRWARLDQQRDRQREIGNMYTQKRNQLAEQYTGGQLSQKINALQIELFGESEAIVIRNEEATGYYRYDSPQKFGFD